MKYWARRTLRKIIAWADLPRPPMVQPTEEPERKGPYISDVALSEATSGYGAALEPFKLPQRPKWISAEMAMDEVTPTLGDLYQWASAGAFSEGLGFLGYPYLSELSQRPEYRRVSEIIAAEATRKFIKFKGDPERIKKIEAAMERFDVRARFRELCEQDGFFGRSQLYLDFGHKPNDEELSKPLPVKPEKIGKDKLKNLKVIEPLWSYPGIYESTNPLHPDFYRPKFWYVMDAQVHSDRLLTIVGRDMPDLLKPAYQFGGLSLSQMVKPYVDNWLRTRQSVSDLVHSFSTMVLKTNMSAILAGGGADSLLKRLVLFTKTRDNRGVMAVDKDTEELENIAVPLGSLDKLQAQAQEHIASVSGIPLVVLLGVTPSGLNASSDGEIKTFYAFIGSYQERTFRSPLQTVINVLQLNECGDIDEDLTFEFVELWEMDEAQKSEIRKADAEVDVGYVNAGIVSNEEARERLAEDEDGLYYGVDLSGPAPEMPEDPETMSDLGSAFDEWKEGDHPRADNGQFGSGGGGGGGGGSSKPAANSSKVAGLKTALADTKDKAGRLAKLAIAQKELATEKDAGGLSFSGTPYQKAANALGFHPVTAEEIAEMAETTARTEKQIQDLLDAETPEPEPAAPTPSGTPKTHEGVRTILGDQAVDKLREMIADKSSTADEVLAVLRPLDDHQQQMTPTLAHDAEPDEAFWNSRQYTTVGHNGESATVGAADAITHLDDVARAYAGVGGVKNGRQARIILGPPAAGKSTSAEEIARNGGYAIVDGDDAKKVIPEFDGGVGAAAVHEESSALSQQVLADLLDTGDNVLLPLVGASPGSIEKRIAILKDAGYNVTVDLVDVSPDEAARRMAGRALRTGRHISSSYFSSVGDGPQRTYEHLQKSNPDVGFGRIDGNGPPRSERYVDAKNHPEATPGQSIFR